MQKTNKKRTLVLGNGFVTTVSLQCGIEVSMAVQNELQPADCTCNFCKLVLLDRNQTYRRETGEKAQCSLIRLETPYVAFRYR